jgi:hypothetical protein
MYGMDVIKNIAKPCLTADFEIAAGPIMNSTLVNKYTVYKICDILLLVQFVVE